MQVIRCVVVEDGALHANALLGAYTPIVCDNSSANGLVGRKTVNLGLWDKKMDKKIMTDYTSHPICKQMYSSFASPFGILNVTPFPNTLIISVETKHDLRNDKNLIGKLKEK
eukprot:bmy_16731T0